LPRLLHASNGEYHLTTSVVNRQFYDTPFPAQAPVRNKPHAHAAADRDAAETFALSLAANLGLEPYFTAAALKNQRTGRRGNRFYYWIKDVMVAPQRDELTSKHLDIHIDVDMHENFHEVLLGGVFVPRLLYTVTPHAVAGTTPEFSWTFQKDGRLTMMYSDGPYEHELWDWSDATTYVTNLSLWRCLLAPWTVRARAYRIARRTTSPCKSLVALSPLANYGIVGALAATFLERALLRRLNPVDGEFTIMDVSDPELGHLRSVGRPGLYVVATLPVAEHDALSVMSTIGANKLSVPTVQKHTGKDMTQSSIATQFHRANAPCQPPLVIRAVEGVRTFAPFTLTYDADGKDLMESFMSPFAHGGFAPSPGVETDDMAVRGRVTNTRSHVESTPFLDTEIENFLSQLVAVPHRERPDHEDAVWQNMDKATQQPMLHDAADGALQDRVGRAFIKKESKQGDARMIVVINPADKFDYSRYTYAAARHAKTQAWFVPGMTPLEIATAVAELAGSAPWVVSTDFERQDGHVAPVARTLERRFMLRLFHTEHHAELLDLMRSQYSLKCYTTHGVEYDSGTSRLSGSPETSLFNTLLSAFICYLAQRATRRDGANNTPSAAYAKIGLCCGDDCLVAGVSMKTLQRAAKDMGQVLTGDSIRAGQPGLKYLARCYGPDVAYGDTNSMTDLLRRLLKLHLTAHLGPKVTPKDKAIQKALDILQTDANTPVIGAWAMNVVARLGTATALDLRGWWAAHPRENQWPNAFAPWMDDLAVEAGIDIALFEEWNSAILDPLDLLSPPLLAAIPEPKPHPTVPLAYDDQVVPAKKKRGKRGGKRHNRRPPPAKDANPGPNKGKGRATDTLAPHDTQPTQRPRAGRPGAMTAAGRANPARGHRR